MFPMTPWVKRLLIANVVAFFVAGSSQLLYYNLAFIPDWFLVLTRPWTIVTYMFLHAGMGHLFFNMIGLFFFGPRLESYLGGKDFLTLYFLSGIGGALLFLVFSPGAPMVGASGAVYGVLMGFATLWPRERIYIWAILPVEAWLLAAIMVVVSLWSGFSGAGGNIAHFAHLGGLGFGYGYLKLRDWRRGAARREFKRKLDGDRPSGITGDRSALRRWESIDVEALHELNREEVRQLLERARTGGVRSLTTEERQFLDRMAAPPRRG